MGFISNILTGKDNKTHDFGRVAGAASLLTGLGLEIYAVYKGQPFDMQAFGIGVAAMATGIGALLKLKETTEPEPEPEKRDA